MTTTPACPEAKPTHHSTTIASYHSKMFRPTVEPDESTHRRRSGEMSFWCKLGYHKGRIKPQYQISEEIDGMSAFVCRRCGEVID